MAKSKKESVLEYPERFPREIVLDTTSQVGLMAAPLDDLSALELDISTEVGIYKLIGVGIVYPQAHLERK